MRVKCGILRLPDKRVVKNDEKLIIFNKDLMNICETCHNSNKEINLQYNK